MTENEKLAFLIKTLTDEQREYLKDVIKYHIAMSSFDISAGGDVSEYKGTVEDFAHELEKSIDVLFNPDNQ